jgi:hypothetical protein
MLFLSNPGQISIKKIVVETNDKNRVTVLMDVEPEYGPPIPAAEHAVVSNTMILSRNIWQGTRSLFTRLTSHSSVTITTAIYDYLKEELDEMADEILDIIEDGDV